MANALDEKFPISGNFILSIRNLSTGHEVETHISVVKPAVLGDVGTAMQREIYESLVILIRQQLDLSDE